MLSGGSDRLSLLTCSLFMSFLEFCENLDDSRTDINKHYDLLDIVFLTMSAVLSGAKGWKAIHIFGVAQLEWLREYREFTHGIPTRHSIGRIIRGIKADSLMLCFEQWVNTIRVHKEREQIAFDGKVVRGSGNGSALNALQLMSAMVVIRHGAMEGYPIRSRSHAQTHFQKER
jgi:hypothetical protein